MKEISFKDRDAIFGRLEELASRGNMSKEERAQYRHEWKVYNDYFNSVDTAKKEGHAEGLKEGRAEGLKEGLEKGRAEEKIENAKKMKDKGSPLDFIADITGLTIEEINNL
mgnify:FL=1